jgi:hypothetical protein
MHFISKPALAMSLVAAFVWRAPRCSCHLNIVLHQAKLHAEDRFESKQRTPVYNIGKVLQKRTDGRRFESSA